jgi:signal transduction histidine kinase
VNNGLPNNVIYGMLEDRLGTLWLSTNLGLSAFSPQKLSTTNFDFFDGLQSNEFNTGAYFKSANGMFYVGGVNGLTFFDPDEILKPRTSPIILKTAVTVNNKILNAHETAHAKNILIIDHIRTSWKENDIGITFTAIDFKQSEKYSFQYSIKDTSWYDIGNRRGFELIDVPSGRYEIAVRARIPGDAWSRGVVLLAVDIVPPIWQRIWFRVVALLMFFAMALAAYRYRITRLRHANAVLNKLVHERTSEIQAKNEEIAAQNDQLQELNKELEAFSYSVSHDLRAPLRSVIGYSKMLEEDYHAHLGEDGNRILRIINQNSLRMNDLINDLLEFSKISRQGLQKSEIDMERFVKNILEDMTTSSQHKAEINVGVLPAVFADRKLLSQVWINLISNAIKYSSKKVNPVIEIGSYAEDNDIIFFVKDNGAGFDMTYVNKLFGVFQRLHKVSEFEGTGVGLALVHRIVAKHGGRVWAEGIVDHGATFYFALPKR